LAMSDPAIAARRSRPSTAYERHPKDASIVVGCLALAAALSVFRLENISTGERAVSRAINHLPDALNPPLEVAMMLGTLFAVPIVALIVLAFGRVRLSAVVLASGLLAYVLAKIAKQLIRAGRPLDVFGDGEVIVRGAAQLGLGYPSGHSAVSAALAFALLPYLPRRIRWWVLLVPLIVGFARVYVGAHLPLDIIGGWAIGIASAFAVHLIVGRPDLRAERVSGVEPASDGSLATSPGNGEDAPVKDLESQTPSSRTG
jgi:glycosyltransferase 2 family protein